MLPRPRGPGRQGTVSALLVHDRPRGGEVALRGPGAGGPHRFVAAWDSRLPFVVQAPSGTLEAQAGLVVTWDGPATAPRALGAQWQGSREHTRQHEDWILLSCAPHP